MNIVDWSLHIDLSRMYYLNPIHAKQIHLFAVVIWIHLDPNDNCLIDLLFKELLSKITLLDIGFS
jgi:hypothetical protein